jgi:RNA polymerase sigma-70 factor (ECF subfamily)
MAVNRAINVVKIAIGVIVIQRSPVIELNRAVAIAMYQGPESGLSLIDDLMVRGELENYHLAHASRGDLCRRLGRTAEARSSYERALALVQQEPERRFLQERLRRLQTNL